MAWCFLAHVYHCSATFQLSWASLSMCLLSAPREQYPRSPLPQGPCPSAFTVSSFFRPVPAEGIKGLGPCFSVFLARSFSHLILSIICALIDSEMSVSRKLAISRSSGLTYPTALMLGPQVKSWVSMWPTQLSMPSAPCPRVPFPVQRGAALCMPLLGP